MKEFEVVDFDVDVDRPRTPSSQGVPVATLVGYYDPEGNIEGYIFPALHGSYGNTFAQDSDNDLRNARCIATISDSSGRALKYALKGQRKDEREEFMNKFHINVAESFNPKKISVQCNGQTPTERSISPPQKSLLGKYTVNGRPLEGKSSHI